MDQQAPSSPQPNEGQAPQSEGYFTLERPASPSAPPSGGAQPGAGAPGGQAGAAAGTGEGNGAPAGAPGGEAGERGWFTYKNRAGEETRFQVPDDLLTPDGQIDATRAAKRAVDLRKTMGERGIDPDAEPVAPPEKYAINIPDDFKGEFEIADDDPDIAAFAPVLQELGVTQEGFDKLLPAYLAVKKAAAEREAALEAEDMAQGRALLAQHFGSEEAAKHAMNRELGPWIQHLLPKEGPAADYMYTMASEAAKIPGVALTFWNLYQATRGAGLAQPGPANQGAAPGLSEDDLRGIMNRPEYWNSGHPDYERLRKQVSDGFSNLYRGQQQEI